MTNLVFLEAATQSEGAATIIESNEALINFATAEVDSLVEEQALHTSWHVGSFVEESFDITYENMTDPISDIVVEATSIFADVIASDGYSDSEKKELIEGYAHMISMGESAAGFGRLISGHSSGAVVGAAGGAVAGAAAGGAVAAVAKLFSSQRKQWKILIKKEQQMKSSGITGAKLKSVTDAKIKAKARYMRAKDNAVGTGRAVGAVVGAVGGGIFGKGQHI